MSPLSLSRSLSKSTFDVGPTRNPNGVGPIIYIPSQAFAEWDMDTPHYYTGLWASNQKPSNMDKSPTIPMLQQRVGAERKKQIYK